jgi:hypothetical protein
MAFYSWLIPILVLVVIGLLAFFYSIKFSGGSGVRTRGRTVVEKPVEDDDDSRSPNE